MDDYTREMMDLKTLVTRTLEKKGVLARIRAELRASVFEAIEEEDRVIEKEPALPPALLGSCNDRAKQLHASPSGSVWFMLFTILFYVLFKIGVNSAVTRTRFDFHFLTSNSYLFTTHRNPAVWCRAGRLLTALICEYLDWAQLSHTLKVYLPECNLEKDFWKAELKEFSSKNGYDLNRNGDSPLLLDVLEGFLRFENLSQARALPNSDSRNMRRPSSSSVAGGLPPLGRCIIDHVSIRGCSFIAGIRRGGSSTSAYRMDEYNWRYDSDELPEGVIQASSALENLHLDRKARNLTSSWRHAGDGIGEDDGRADHV
ncbi:hypothetical protein Ahy_A09g041756 isoform B [Arachis hypogaea]|uniref:Uncharacterized protein n=1 Tax=Arachis hypogaea TaxID=3818 RepID=A0A445BDP4_ARAHY|nr:hypothetical protein Ahy_A09g041756 isoform B [Arachis hypogaea]